MQPGEDRSNVDPHAPVTQSRLWPLNMYRYSKTGDDWKKVNLKHQCNHSFVLPPQKELPIYTWNVDFESHNVMERLEAAFEVLREDVGEPAPPCIILLQEIHAKALKTVKMNPWVQKYFYVTPLDHLKWPYPHGFGNITLVHRSVQVKRAAMLEYRMSRGYRTAIMVDIRMHAGRDESETQPYKLIRVINTHLESNRDGEACRREQLQLCASFLLDESKGCDGGIIGGDLNAFDADSEQQVDDVGLADAIDPTRYKSAEEGYTWGFQINKPSDLYFPKSRMDKFLYTPHRSFYVTHPDILGRGARDQGGRFISDHFALAADIVIQE
ncbi:endonuclease exonuclease phosphatase family protein [Moniliophthora roreri MCA 2997]|uniref:Endonuclease exonuclease phosphatase family protein n=2 Tax=Moniliophthora roreri TaxID=221103 RepID=V2YSL7_MONRO|nr:endonuclease exonuclease phosphatase family protein [Moniliophthora roreri MCA 2997]